MVIQLNAYVENADISGFIVAGIQAQAYNEINPVLTVPAMNFLNQNVTLYCAEHTPTTLQFCG